MSSLSLSLYFPVQVHRPHTQRIPRYLLPALTKEMSEKTSAMLEPVMFLAVLTFVE